MQQFAKTPAPQFCPWGPIETATEMAPGIWAVTTPSHGGIGLSIERLGAMPEYIREAGDMGGGWFEEDCCWALVALAFPDAFRQQDVDNAEKTVRAWYSSVYKRWNDERTARLINMAVGMALMTEPTDQGNQYVIPGCEKDRTRGPAQLGFW